MEISSSKNRSGMSSHSVVLQHKVSGENVVDLMQKTFLEEKSLQLLEQNVSDVFNE